MNSEITDKLSKLIPRLAIDQDGGIIATVRAIARLLKSDGHDFHDLAEALTTRGRLSGTASYYGYQREEKPPKAGLNTRDGFLRRWTLVATEILKRHHTVTKRYGGKFLLAHQIELLERIRRGEEAGHLHEGPIKIIDDRMRTAFEAWQTERKSKAA